MSTVSTSSRLRMSERSLRNLVVFTITRSPASISMMFSFSPSKSMLIYPATLSKAPVLAQKLRQRPRMTACITELGLNMEGCGPIW